MLKTGDIIYKVTLEGYDIPCVVVKKYKVGQRLSKIDGTEGGGYLLKLAVRADQYLYLGDYIEDINCGILSRNPVNWKLNKVHVIRLINQ